MLLRGWGDAVGRARAGDKGRGSSHFANFARRDESGSGVDASGRRGRVGVSGRASRVDESGTAGVSKADGRVAWDGCMQLIFNAIKNRHPIGGNRVC